MPFRSPTTRLAVGLAVGLAAAFLFAPVQVRAQGGFLSKLGGEDPWILLERGADEDKILKALDDIVTKNPPGAGRKLLNLFARQTHASATIRSAMALGLARLNHRAAAPYLWRLLREENKATRGAALEALGMLLGAKVTPLLLRAIRRPALAAFAQRALVRLGGPARTSVERLLGQPGPTARLAAEVLADIGDSRSVGPLIRAMKRFTLPSAFAVRLLGRFRDRRVSNLLLRLIIGKNQTLASAALSVLEPPLPPRTAEALMHALGGGAVDKSRALTLLGRTRAAGAVTVILSFAKHPDMRLRETALGALGQLRTAAAVKALSRLAQPKYRRMYFASLRGLAVSRRSEAVAALIPHTKWSGRVGVAAIHALGTLMRQRASTLVGSRRAAGGALHRTVRLLTGLTRVKDSRAAAALTALGRIAAPDSLDLLVRLFKGKKLRDRRLACRGLGLQTGRETLVELFEGALRKDPDKHVASCAARALGEIKSTRSTALLAASLRDPRVPVACNASASLVRLGGRAAARALKGVLASPDACLRANAALGMGRLKVKSAIPRLRRLAQSDPWPAVKINAGRALAILLGKRARAYLADLMTSDKDPPVRKMFRSLAAGVKPRARMKGKDFVAFWVLPGGKKKTSGWKFYRIVLPGGLVRDGFTDEFGYAAEDGLHTGEADLHLD
jgi:HEAT repeat protein